MKYKIKGLKKKYITEDLLATLKHLSVSTVSNEKKARKQFKEIKKNKNHKMFVALDKETNKVIGLATLLIEPKFSHDFGFLGHVEDVVVQKEFEGQGIGKTLVKRVMREADKANCYRLLLDCSDENIEFYEKLGFHKRGNEMILDL